MIDLKNCRAFTLEPGTPDQRLETLERIVLDLMTEIEALRTAMIALESANDPFGRAVFIGVPSFHELS
jgi:hypothetical protein